MLGCTTCTLTLHSARRAKKRIALMQMTQLWCYVVAANVEGIRWNKIGNWKEHCSRISRKRSNNIVTQKLNLERWGNFISFMIKHNHVRYLPFSLVKLSRIKLSLCRSKISVKWSKTEIIQFGVQSTVSTSE